MKKRLVKKNLRGESFFTRLRSAWLVLRGKTPHGFNAIQHEQVDIARTWKTAILARAEWWARDGRPVEVAKDAIAQEFMKAIRPNIKYTVEPCEGGQGMIVRGDLWICG